MGAARLAKMVSHSDCDAFIGVDGSFCPADNILSLLSLQIQYGDIVSIVADGPEAHEVVENIHGLLCEDSKAGTCLPVLFG